LSEIGCYIAPPYLDEYGETDQGLRRGNPMKLSEEKYAQIRKLWAAHKIPEEISRMTEMPGFAAAFTNWQYL